MLKEINLTTAIIYNNARFLALEGIHKDLTSL